MVGPDRPFLSAPISARNEINISLYGTNYEWDTHEQVVFFSDILSVLAICSRAGDDPYLQRHC